jgi:hypothetical protein
MLTSNGCGSDRYLFLSKTLAFVRRNKKNLAINPRQDRQSKSKRSRRRQMIISVKEVLETVQKLRLDLYIGPASLVSPLSI